jgi:hypothetical protein
MCRIDWDSARFAVLGSMYWIAGNQYRSGFQVDVIALHVRRLVNPATAVRQESNQVGCIIRTPGARGLDVSENVRELFSVRQS